MRARKWVGLLASAALLAACGGGGGSETAGPVPALEQSFHLGLVRGDVQTATTIVVTKPFEEAGTVELAGAPGGPFATGALPMTLGPAAKCALIVAFTPPPAAASAMQQGSIPLRFTSAAGGEARMVTLRLDAEIETPSARLGQTHLVLGNAALGETVPCAIAVENTSIVTPVTLTSATLSGGGFSFAAGPAAFPAVVQPGASFLVKMAYAPTADSNDSSLLRVHHSAAPAPLEATLDAGGVPAQVVVDYGTLPLDPVTGESPWLTLDVGPEAVGIFLEAWGSPDAVLDLIGFEGPAGRVYETPDLKGPLDWLSGCPAGVRGFLTVEVPDSARPEVQLAEGGGTYRFRFRDRTVSTPDVTVRATVSQRHNGEVTEGTVDLRVFLANGIWLVDPQNPMADAKLATTLKTVDAALGANGIRIGKITFAPIMDLDLDVLQTEDDRERMLAISSPVTPGARTLNLFLVREMLYGVAAESGASPGSWDSKVTTAGVVVAYDAYGGSTLGVMAAHEISHYLGVFRPGILPAPADAHEMLRHPIVNPGLPEETLSTAATYAQAQGTAASMPPVTTWCGTCKHAPVR
ncbi:MAG TPA: hypothetical protein VFY93_00055 [Planctomycetota bacterium]|nr:hypothetical protein [Planctomycetota bacterium]